MHIRKATNPLCNPVELKWKGWFSELSEQW